MTGQGKTSGGASAPVSSSAQEPRKRCGAGIEKEWKGHTAVLSRSYCRAWPLKGYSNCRYHLYGEEWARYHGFGDETS